MDQFILDNCQDKKDKEKEYICLIHKIFIMEIGLKMLSMGWELMCLGQVNATVDS